MCTHTYRHTWAHTCTHMAQGHTHEHVHIWHTWAHTEAHTHAHRGTCTQNSAGLPGSLVKLAGGNSHEAHGVGRTLDASVGYLLLCCCTRGVWQEKGCWQSLGKGEEFYRVRKAIPSAPCRNPLEIGVAHPSARLHRCSEIKQYILAFF